MKIINVFIIVVMMLAFGCSNTKKDQKTDSIPTVENAPAEETDLFANGDDGLFSESENNKPAEQIAEAPREEPAMMASENQIAPMEKKDIVISETAEYTTKKGDTLMLIAFKVFGDYRRWREIGNYNRGMDTKNLSAGMVIKYPRPEKEFVWQPEGEPYLIKKGDYLGSISLDKYGTVKRWKDIWNNNKPQIKDPNLIFAGFTLYYIPDNKTVASN